MASTSEIRILARRLVALERKMLQQKQPNLGFSTIDGGGAIQATDEADVLTMIVGKQFDDTSTAAVVTGPTPPIPTTPFVTAQAGALRIYWDGTYSNAQAAPMDFARVLAYAAPLASIGTPNPLDQTIMVGQFTSATGGELTAALDPDVEYGVFLASWTQAGKYSPASIVAVSTVGTIVTGADLAAKSSIYRQDTPPWANGATGHADDIGDMWVDTTLQPGPTQSIDTWSITSNVVTINTDSTHELSDGMSIAVVGVDPTVDGNYIIATSTPTSLTFPLVHANVGSTVAPEEATVQGLEVDPLNRYHIWDGGLWVDTQDSGISDAATLAGGAKSAADNNSQTISDAQNAIAALAVTATDALDTATAADGRVAISDYEPTSDDVAGKNDGSLWITRTRDRRNIALNPSFEVSTANWTAAQLATVVRQAAGIGADGSWCARLTNNTATTANHKLMLDSVAVGPGESLVVSGYMRAVSGLCTGHFAQIAWYDASSVLITTVNGTGINLITSAADPNALGGWQRAWMTAQAPANTASARISFAGPAANINDVWELDAVLVERSSRLGRYFDGGSEGGSWSGTSELSESILDGGAIIRLFNLEDGAWSEKFWTADTISSVDVKSLRSATGYVRPVGLADTAMDGALLGDNTVAIDKNFMPNVVASEAIFAGALVNVWNNAGVAMVRLAKAVPGYDAHGFILTAATTGQQPVVYTSGYNPLQTALTPGVQFISVTPGKCSATPAQDVGTMVQRVGQAVSATTIDFAALTSVVLT